MKEIKITAQKQSMTSSGSISISYIHYDIKLKITKIFLHHENEGFSLFIYDEVQITPIFLLSALNQTHNVP